MTSRRESGSFPWRVLAVLTGTGLVLVAALIPGAGIERTFGRSPRSLAWGPALFRLLLSLHGLLLVGAGFLRRPTAAGDARVPEASKPGTPPIVWGGLALVCLTGLVLRMIRLDSGLWYDEIATLLDWVRAPFGVTLTSLPNQNNHIFFSLLAKTAVVLFGESAWSVRLPSVLFGVGSIWALFLLGRRVLGNREALLASALLAVSYHHVWFSQNARGYSGLLFFSILSTWLWLEALPRRSWLPWVAYAVSVSLGMWVHLTMAFVVASHGLVYLPLLAGSIRRGATGGDTPSPVGFWQPLLGFLLSVTLTLQLYALALPEFLTTGLHEVSRPSDWVSPVWLLLETVRGLVAGFSGGVLLLGSVLLLGGAVVAVSGWLSILRREWHVAVVMALPGLLIVALMVALGHNLWPRFLFFSAGFALLILVHGAFVAPRLVLKRVLPSGSPGRIAAISGYVLCGLMILASIASLPRNYALPKQDYQRARDWVEENIGSGDAVATAGLAAKVYTRYYAPTWVEVGSASELAALGAEHERVWFVYSLPVHFRSHHPDLLGLLEADFETVRVFPGTLSGGEVYVCRRGTR